MANSSSTVQHPATYAWQGESRNRTAGTGITPPKIPTTTRTTAVLLTEDAHELRNQVRTLNDSATQTHQKTYQHEWQVHTQRRGVEGTSTLLNDLADLGFSWRAIARMVGVSVPALQKWRKGERPSAANRHKLASLLAACDFISTHLYVEEIGQWFEMPVIEDVPITPIDLWSAGHQLLVFEHVTQHLAPEEVMNQFDSEWRERFQSNFETFIAADGERSIRMKDR